MNDQSIPTSLKASHYGVVKFGDLSVEAVVLENGERGYVRKQLAKSFGFHETHKGGRFTSFLADFAPNSLIAIEKKGWPILMPSGQTAQFFPAGIIHKVALGVVAAAAAGSLHKARLKTVPRCLAVLDALSTIGEVALIDEATGYQYIREPDALQNLFNRLLLQSSASWERRFRVEYYEALFSLFGWTYRADRHHSPVIIGDITLKWVYQPIFPQSIIDEIRSRKDDADKYHQWLSDESIRLLIGQIGQVTAVAKSSSCYRDFESRCAAAFNGMPLQLGF